MTKTEEVRNITCNPFNNMASIKEKELSDRIKSVQQSNSLTFKIGRTLIRMSSMRSSKSAASSSPSRKKITRCDEDSVQCRVQRIESIQPRVKSVQMGWAQVMTELQWKMDSVSCLP
ncbi:hypothetical protein O0L34_g9442 [Tuta absoluta]|nr:hypothetical protein O0L34_g9442 [Tuta absoluta]